MKMVFRFRTVILLCDKSLHSLSILITGPKDHSLLHQASNNFNKKKKLILMNMITYEIKKKFKLFYTAGQLGIFFIRSSIILYTHTIDLSSSYLSRIYYSCLLVDYWTISKFLQINNM